MKLTCSLKKHSLEKRKAEAKRILEKYSDKIPIIVSKEEKSKLNDIDKCKYLAPEDITLAQFAVIIRKRIKLSESDAFFFFTEVILCLHQVVLFVSYMDTTKTKMAFYLYYCGENVFGN